MKAAWPIRFVKYGPYYVIGLEEVTSDVHVYNKKVMLLTLPHIRV